MSHRRSAEIVALALGAWLAGCDRALNSSGPVGLGPEVPGIIEVTVAVEGTRPDADGYGVTLVGADARGEPVGSAGGTVRFPDLPPGSHSVRLDGLAPNCVVEGANPRRFHLQPNQTLRAQFFVQCPGPGKLLITTVSRGADLDLDGFMLSLEGPSLREERIGANDSLLIDAEELSPDGSWNLRLSQVPDNCLVESRVSPEEAVTSIDPLEVRLLGDVTVRVRLSAACLPRSSRIAFADFPTDVYIVPGNGGRAVNVTNHGIADDWATDGAPALSPDRSRIAFVSNRGTSLDYWSYEFLSDLYTVDSDGRDLTRLTNTLGYEWIGPQAWSPDGSRIAFTYSDTSGTDIYLMSADGSGVVRLTEDGSIGCPPAWSPDGVWIAFCVRGGIYRIAPVAGSPMIPLISEGTYPAWSPDGSRIAYVVTNPRAHLAVVGIDGMGFLPLNPNGKDYAFAPSWSPDGSWIAFTHNDRDLAIVPYLGDRFGEVVRIRSGSSPSWR